MLHFSYIHFLVFVFKLQCFFSLSGLTEPERFGLLKRCEEGDLTAKGLKKEATIIKKRNTIKQRIAELLGTDSYNTSQHLYDIDAEDVERFVTGLCIL